jgi:hypothetical protein
LACECHIAGLLNINYQGIISASLNGSTQVSISSSGLILLGATLNSLTITAYPFAKGGDPFLGVSCNASANASVRWLQRYDCNTDTTYFIPQSGGVANIINGPINGVQLVCDANVNSRSFSANASSGPVTPYITSIQRNGFNLRYTGLPISVESGSPSPYSINLGPFSVVAYLQSFSLTVNPPSPANVTYSFVIPDRVL